jgi:hypothetical protein
MYGGIFLPHAKAMMNPHFKRCGILSPNDNRTTTIPKKKQIGRRKTQ